MIRTIEPIWKWISDDVEYTQCTYQQSLEMIYIALFYVVCNTVLNFCFDKKKSYTISYEILTNILVMMEIIITGECSNVRYATAVLGFNWMLDFTSCD